MNIYKRSPARASVRILTGEDFRADRLCIKALTDENQARVRLVQSGRRPTARPDDVAELLYP